MDESFLCLLSPACRRRPRVWTWQGGPEFIWCGTRVDTLHYSEVPGSRMNITQPSSCLPLWRSPGLPKRGAALIFPAPLVLEGLRQLFPSLSTPLNPAQEKPNGAPTEETNSPLAQMQSDTSLVRSKYQPAAVALAVALAALDLHNNRVCLRLTGGTSVQIKRNI